MAATQPTAEELAGFAACESHAEQCAYFAAHLNLGSVYRDFFFTPAPGGLTAPAIQRVTGDPSEKTVVQPPTS